MKTKFLSLALAPLLSVLPAVAQTPAAPAAATSPTPAAPAPKEDFKPASSNLRGKDYPQVNSERRVRYRVVAPEATSVKVMGGGAMDLTKGADGVWMGTSEPRDEGLHTYTLNIDGAEVPDSNSIVFGSNSARVRNGIEIPAADQDFYALKNVPHGQIREVRYFAKSSNAMRQAQVYTPPDYDKDVTKRFPVLYLQHGTGEDETFWGGFQGRAGLIMDNLIAEGKAKSFIIVMESSQSNGIPLGGTATPPAPAAPAAPAAGGAAAPGGRGGGMNFGPFERVLIEDLIPHIDANFRTIANRENRGMAGLSLGGMQTRSIGLKHLDQFSQIGVFSGGSVTAEEAAAIPNFKDKVKVLFLSYGSREIPAPGGAAVPAGEPPTRGRGGNGASVKTDVAALKQAGVNVHFYVSPETGHEWQSWRRSLYQFAPLAFRN